MSGDTFTLSLEGEINAVVKEYLEYSHLEKTLGAFEEECLDHGKPIKHVGQKQLTRSSSKMVAIQNEMVQLFQYGKCTEFFDMWDDHLPDTVRQDDITAQKLEFCLHIYFAIYPVRNGKENTPDSEEAMTHFKKYLESGGAKLSQTTEFLPFYALPFVPNPKSHPSYKELFADSWVPDLQQRLESYLTSALQSEPQPRIVELYKSGSGDSKDMKEQQQLLQQQLVDAERRCVTYMKRYNKIQADYHNLIGITADLVDSLEATVQGRMITPEYLQKICTRLFQNQMRQSVAASTIDFTRPGTAGEALRASVVQPILQSQQDPFSIPLDFEKIKQDLLSNPDRNKALLLQALRWRLTRAAPEQRDNVLHAYIQTDLLGCATQGSQRKAILDLLSSPSEVVRQYTARLFNAFASLCEGRNYLSLNLELLRALMDNLRAEDKDSMTRENVLGALQKLSLRRNLQTAMIHEGIIQWLVHVLEDNDSLSDYTLEYSVALMMNLCLRTAGKKKCSENAHEVLQVLSDLLGHENHEIRPYVNGALYSILAIPSVREEARAMDLEGILKCFLKDGQLDTNRQLEFILKQLNSKDDYDGAESDDEEEEEDEEDQDAMEADLDKAEVLKAQPKELSGEKLLLTEYAVTATQQTKKKKSLLPNEPLHRPITPSQVHMAYSTSHHAPQQQSNRNAAMLTPVNERPPTRSGSRPSTQGTPTPRPVTVDPVASDMVSKALGKDRKLAAADHTKRITPSNKALEKVGGKANEYTTAFSSRPRCTRTPDVSSGRPISRGGLGENPTPTPKFSESLPRSRPGSSNKNIGSKSTTAVKQQTPRQNVGKTSR